MSAKRYRVQGTDLNHDGQHIPEGGEVTLDDATAAQLSPWLTVVDGAAEQAAAEKAAAEKAAAEKAAAEKAAAEQAAAEKVAAEKVAAEQAAAEKAAANNQKGGKK